MSAPLVPDDLWEAIAPLLPKDPPKPKGGRPRVPDRAALAGIIFVLRTCCPWRLLPKELGCGSGTTCWRRLHDWQEAGVWEQLHTKLLNWLGDEAGIDWSRASVDSLSVRAKRGASRPARTPSTVANPAPSTTWSWTGTASRWQSGSPQPTPTTPPSCFRSSTLSRQSLAPGGALAVLGNAPPSCTPRRRMTHRSSAALCGLAVSHQGLLAAASTPASGWDGTGGWSNARLPGCSATAASASAMSGGPTCSRGCSTWPVR
jgi:transposase